MCNSCFFPWYEKGLLNFETERKKLVYRINNTRLAFQTSKTTIYRGVVIDEEFYAVVEVVE